MGFPSSTRGAPLVDPIAATPSPWADVAPVASATTRGVPAPGLVALLGVQAWVWTASVLPKVTSGTFLNGFARFVARAPRGRPVFYSRLVSDTVLVAPSLFAWGAIVTESLLAFILTVVAVVALRRGSASRLLLLVSVVASLVGAGFALNLALLVGDHAPWALGHPFDSGVAVEYLLAGLALATAASAIAIIRQSTQRPGPSAVELTDK